MVKLNTLKIEPLDD